MLKILSGLALVTTLVLPVGLPVGEAQAQEGAWCAYAGGRNAYENCGYYTLEQCRAAVSGVGGACMPNPRGGYTLDDRRRYYDDEPPPRRRVRPY